MTWIVTCPNWQSEIHKNTVQSWTLSLEELRKIGNLYFEKRIDCKVCHYKFSLQHGVKESFSIDNPFVIHDFQFNSQENGSADIKIGQLSKIKFCKPFEDIPQIYLTPYLKPAHVVSGYVTKTGFYIFSSNSGTEGETRKIGWSAFGNREQKGIPIWRKLLSSSKEHHLRKDFQSEIVYLESAFEMFVSEFLWKKLSSSLNDESITWILKFSIEEQLKIGFTIFTGKSLSQLEPDSHGTWQREVKMIRDNVIHRGISIKADQAQKARAATFDLITRINSETLDYFKIQRV
jgi:hypothetical protein